MGCSNCDCTYCQEDRDGEEDYHQGMGEQAAPIREPLLVTDEQRTVWAKEMDTIFNLYAGARINMAAMQSMILQRIGVKAVDYVERAAQVADFIRERCDDPASGMSLARGRLGGIYRSAPTTATSVPIRSTAIDYTCKGCNVVLKDLSQGEKSCYRCGEAIAR